MPVCMHNSSHLLTQSRLIYAWGDPSAIKFCSEHSSLRCTLRCYVWQHDLMWDLCSLWSFFIVQIIHHPVSLYLFFSLINFLPPCAAWISLSALSLPIQFKGLYWHGSGRVVKGCVTAGSNGETHETVHNWPRVVRVRGGFGWPGCPCPISRSSTHWCGWLQG